MEIVTDRPNDRPTDKQTDLRGHRKVTLTIREKLINFFVRGWENKTDSRSMYLQTGATDPYCQHM